MCTNYLKIKEIVRSVSETHSFNQERLLAVNTSDVENGSLLEVAYMPTSELKGQFKKTIKQNDILFSEIRPANRRFALIKITETSDYVVSTKLMVLRKFNANVDLDYFYYCLTNQPFLEILQRRAENRICSFPQITFDLLGEYKFPIPPLKDQTRIASIIRSIDDMIEINRAINRNLEAMAKQLYDYWFVQFDFPDESGKPYKSSGGKMVWNEKLKREIPEGWSSSNLGNLISLFDYQRVPLSNIQRETRKGQYPYYGATGIMDYIDDYIFDGEYLLLAEDGSTSDCNGNPIVQYIWGKNWVNNHAHIIRPLDNSQITYYFHLLKAIPAKAIETGSIQKKISQENLLGYNVVNAPISLIQQFSMTVQKLQNERMQSVETINRLQRLRDELLPLLMNGQVTVTPPAVNCDL
jgi:type I restriction enzyme S subunit